MMADTVTKGMIKPHRSNKAISVKVMVFGEVSGQQGQMFLKRSADRSADVSPDALG